MNRAKAMQTGEELLKGEFRK